LLFAKQLSKKNYYEQLEEDLWVDNSKEESYQYMPSEGVGFYS